MRFLEAHFPNLHTVLERDALWMVWNTYLAWLPVGLAVLLFRDPSRRRTALWWVGAVLFGLFLPNAPYVVTDLVHLEDTLNAVPTLSAPLGLYAGFIASGFVAYYLSLKLLCRYLAANGRGQWTGVGVVGIHAVCAVGVFLGRHARLNSWEPVVEPTDTVERIVLALSWRYAPIMVVGTFAVTWIGHFVTKTILETAWRTVVVPGLDLLRRVARPAAGHPTLG